MLPDPVGTVEPDPVGITSLCWIRSALHPFAGSGSSWNRILFLDPDKFTGFGRSDSIVSCMDPIIKKKICLIVTNNNYLLCMKFGGHWKAGSGSASAWKAGNGTAPNKWPGSATLAVTRTVLYWFASTTTTAHCCSTSSRWSPLWRGPSRSPCQSSTPSLGWETTHRRSIVKEEKAKVVATVWRDRIDSIHCPAIYFAPGWFDERDEFFLFFISSWCKSSNSSIRPNSKQPAW